MILNVNGAEYEFSDINNLMASLFNIPIHISKKGSFDAFRINTIQSFELIKELCVIEKETLESMPTPKDTHTKKIRSTEKAACTRTMSKMNNLIHLAKNSSRKETLYTLLYDMILAKEGMPLLSGFSYTCKKHKSNPVGNAEKVGVMRFNQ